MPLFTYSPPPFTLEEPDVTVLTGTATTAGRAFFTAVVLNAPVTVPQMRCYVSSASPTGNIDMGIYDATGTNGAPNNRLGSTGAIAATTGVFTQNLTANLLLAPGRYWLALLDTVADSIGIRSSLAANIGVAMQTSSTSLSSLPSTASTVANSIFRVGLIALLSGNWS
jgi:hypothetical protein